MKPYLTILYLLVAIPVYGLVIKDSIGRGYLPNAILLVSLLFILQIYTIYKK